MEASSKAAVIFILLNILLFTCVSSTKVKCPPPKTRKPPSSHPPISTTPKKPATCPKDVLKFGVCADLLGLVQAIIGVQPSGECCALLTSLTDVEAALCLCTAIKANVLGLVNVQASVAISAVINSCGKKFPYGFKCA